LSLGRARYDQWYGKQGGDIKEEPKRKWSRKNNISPTKNKTFSFLL
jgi:hypothetical protein